MVEAINPPQEISILILIRLGNRDISEASATPLRTKIPGIISMFEARQVRNNLPKNPADEKFS